MKNPKFEYGFQSIDGIIKKVYYLSDIPNVAKKCDMWNMLPIAYVRMWTGQMDKNKVDIYDGDICKSESDKVIFAVKWDNEASAFLACIENESVPFSWFGSLGSECIKIGNIYDNPELLKD